MKAKLRPRQLAQLQAEREALFADWEQQVNTPARLAVIEEMLRRRMDREQQDFVEGIDQFLRKLEARHQGIKALLGKYRDLATAKEK